MTICAGLMSGCVGSRVSDSALALGLRKPIDRLNAAVLTPDIAQIRAAARDVISTYDAAVGPR